MIQLTKLFVSINLVSCWFIRNLFLLPIVIRDHTIKGRHLDVKKAISKADMDKLKRGGGPPSGPSSSGRGDYRGYQEGGRRDRYMDRGGDLWERRDSWSNSGSGGGGGWSNGDHWVGGGSSGYQSKPHSKLERDF